MRLASYHIHTNFCDGNDTPEQMALAALSGGMTDIGFSAHAAWPVGSEWHMAPDRYGAYLSEIARLKAAYAGRLAICAGFEADWIAGITAPDPAFYGRFKPDYLIGSVHYVPTDRKDRITPLWSVDASAEEVQEGIRRCFDGDGRRAACAYWSALRDMIASCRFDIVGHPDLLRKRNGDIHFFDESATWYRDELTETVKVIARSGKIVELNTGAIARKAMDDIYPSAELLGLLFRAGVPVTLNSDSHSADTLTCAYDRARNAARNAGYASFMYLDDSGWAEEPF